MSKAKPPSKSRRKALIVAILLAAVALALVAAWHWTPLADYAEPRQIARWLRGQADSPWMLPIVATIYVAASLVVFPNSVLSLAVIMALGPVAGAAYAYGGSLAAALVGFTIGRRGGAFVEKLRLKGFDKASARLRRGGFMPVLTMRILPIAPFSVTNVLCGASGVRLLPFVAATLVGISHYILGFAAFGHQARRLMSNPTGTDMAVTAAIAAVMVGLAIWQVRAAAPARAKS